MHLPVFCNNWASAATSGGLADNRHGVSWGLSHAAGILGVLGEHSHGCRPASCDDRCPLALPIQFSKASKHFRIWRHIAIDVEVKVPALRKRC